MAERQQTAATLEIADDLLAMVLQARHRRLKRIVLDTHRAPRAAALTLAAMIVFLTAALSRRRPQARTIACRRAFWLGND